MICRLCVNNLNENNAIQLFNYNENSAESNLVKMIAKYFQLELTVDDSVSTSICNECWVHLDDFDQFCKHVELKQSNLRNEFLEVKGATLLTDALAEEALIENNDESLLDIKDVFVECDTLISEGTAAEFGYANIAKEVADSDGNKDVSPKIALKVNSSEKKSNKRPYLPKPKSKKEKKSPEFTKSLRSSKRIKIEGSPILGTSSFNTKYIRKEIDEREIVSTSTDKTTKKIRSSKRSKIKNGPASGSTTCTDNEIAEEDEIVATSDETKALSKQFAAKKSAESDELISNNMRLKCELCEAPMETFAKLQGHFRTEHNCKGYVHCCGKRFVKRIVLVNHIRLHLNPNYFQCKICNKVLKSSSCLEMHMQNAHPRDEDLKCECTVCGKRFPRQNNLNAHSLSHQTEKDFACEHCDKAFVTKNRLDVHIRSVHDNIFLHVCDICGRKFKFKPSFEQHMREHNGIFEEPAQCSLCGEWLKHKDGLRKHLMRHRETEEECKICGRVCPSKRALQSHVRYNHQMGRNLQCVYCDKTFKMKKNLDEHIAMHTGEKHHKCSYCTREFRSRANMYAHIKRDHFEEWKIARSKAPPNVLTTQ